MNQSLIVSDHLLQETVRTVRSFWHGRRKHEGVCFWLGIERDNLSIVTTCVAPQADTSPGHFRIKAVDNARMVWAASSAGLYVLAQIHSHPLAAGTDHSRGDDRDAFMPSEGYYSLIIPNYASSAPAIAEWGIHRYESGRFRKLIPSEVQQTIRVVPSFLDLRL